MFRRSFSADNLAAAYGIAVSLTMLLTSVLLFIAMREIWGWSPIKAGAIALVFLVVDCGFFTSNLTKVLDGGHMPLLIAVAVYGVMWIWHRGTSAVRALVIADEVPLKKFIETIGAHDIARVPGSAVFLTRADSETPPVLVWHVRKNRSLHEYVLILKLVVTSSPRTKPSERLEATMLSTVVEIIRDLLIFVGVIAALLIALIVVVSKLPDTNPLKRLLTALCYRLGATLAAGAIAIPLEPIPGIDLAYDIGVPIVLIWYWFTFFRGGFLSDTFVFKQAHSRLPLAG